MTKRGEPANESKQEELCITLQELEAGDDRSTSFSERFELIRPLGKGAFGLVILARDKLAFGRERAVKVKPKAQFSIP
jgi:hypothetical protein